MKIDIEKQSKELSATVNSLCRENAELTREELMVLLDSITTCSPRITKAMRDEGIIILIKKGREFTRYKFIPQKEPIHWKVFWNILFKAYNRNKLYQIHRDTVRHPVIQPTVRAYDTWVTDSTDNRFTYIK